MNAYVGPCWVGAAHAVARNLAKCCHDKLEVNHFCEADGEPIYKMALKVRADFGKCANYKLMKQSKTNPGVWEDYYTKGEKGGSRGPSDPEAIQHFCHQAAQKFFYMSLDLKDWYLKNTLKSGGASAQCEQDQDDDWINTGDKG